MTEMSVKRISGGLFSPMYRMGRIQLAFLYTTDYTHNSVEITVQPCHQVCVKSII